MAKKNRPDSATPKDKKAEDRAKKWLAQIEDSIKRETKYRKLAAELVDIYEEPDEVSIPFNILYANTETLAPALFNSAPRPDTRPRSKVPNATVDAAAGLVDAFLENFVDTGDARYETFSSVISDGVVSALVPGRGCARVHYKAEVKRDEAGAPERLIDESVFSEAISWDKIHLGYAKKWDRVPWVAFEHCMTYDEAEEEFGPEKASTLKYDRPESGGTKLERDEAAGAEISVIYEIWCRTTKTVYWLESCGKEFLREIPDPYGLEGFFPIPKPLAFFQRTKGLIPVPLYKLYKQQAEELNRITRRITHLIEGMKIRGFYDSQVTQIEKLFESDDNTLLAITNLTALGQGAKAENAIYLVPLEKYGPVLQQLLQNRQEILQVIYQIMGIADIMRGSTQASETLGAQEIKNKWGTLRLKRAQKVAAEFVRDTMRLAAELAFSKMSPENLRMLTGSKLLGQAEADKLEQAVAQAQATGQEVPPEIQAQLALPTFDECIELLRSDIVRRYSIDIETNSTIDAEASEDKEDMAEFLNAFSQFLNGLFPMVEAGVLPAETLKGVLMALSKRFRMGRDLDPYFQKIGQNPGGGMEAQKKQLEEQSKALADGQKKLAAEAEKVKKEKQAVDKAKMDLELKSMQAEVAQIKSGLMKEVKDAKAQAAIEKLIIRLERTMMKAQAPQEEAHADV